MRDKRSNRHDATQVVHVELRVMPQRVEGLMAQQVFDVIQVGPATIVALPEQANGQL